MANMNKKTV